MTAPENGDEEALRDALKGARFALFCSDMDIKDRADQALRLALEALTTPAAPGGGAGMVKAPRIEDFIAAVRACPSLDENGYICEKSAAISAILSAALAPAVEDRND